MKGFVGLLKRAVGWGESSAVDATARFKAHVAGEGIQVNALAADDKTQVRFSSMGALEPPLPFDRLCAIFFTSNSLRQNIDAYVTNCESFGWVPQPTIDLWGPRAEKNVTDVLTMQKGGEEPTAEEVKSTLKTWKAEAARERARLEHFFQFVHPEDTFTEIRRKKRFDEELLGNAAWEVIRNREGNMAVFNHVPFVTMRLMLLDKTTTEVEIPHKTDDVTLGSTTMFKRFRRFVQVQEELPAIWFREFGDPRTLSSKTGRVYADVAAMRREEGETVREATEILHFKLHAPNQSYGVARWIGNLISVMGSRMSEEVNFLYFENKGVPPLAIIFSGGRIAADSVRKIESFIENKIKGLTNFHSVLILEAETEGGDAKNTGRGTIKIQPLVEAQQQDALFQNYDRNNIEKVGASFRVPGILRGDTAKIDRATAEIVVELTEQQVFQPERDSFDGVMNSKILPRMGIRFWTFRTKKPRNLNPRVVGDLLAKLAAAGIIMPDEGRELIGEALGTDLPRRDDAFLSRPLRLAIAEVRARAAQARREQQGSRVQGDAKSKSDLSTQDLETMGGLLQPQQGRPKDCVPGVEEDCDEQGRRRERRRAMVVLAKDLVELKSIMEMGEITADVLKLPDADFDELFGARDGVGSGATTP